MAETDETVIKSDIRELEPEQKRKVFIGSLSYRIDENTFREYWTRFGTVLDAMILRDREGRSRGFGFVTFDNSASVDAVMKARPHSLDNRVVEPKRAVPREESHKPDMQLSVKKLYVGGIKEPLTEDDLRDYFGQYGSISEVTIMKDRDGQYRGFGFVEFDDYDPVDRIVLDKNHHVAGRTLDVQKAQTKDASQRSTASNRSMRSRGGGPPPSMSRSNYDSGYEPYPPPPLPPPANNYNGPYGQMPASNYNGYNSNYPGNNGNDAPFGQGYGQESFTGPMRRGHPGGRGYAPYSNRGRGVGGGGGPSWMSWN